MSDIEQLQERAEELEARVAKVEKRQIMRTAIYHIIMAFVAFIAGYIVGGT